MKNIKLYIQEGFKIGKTKAKEYIEYKYFPKDRNELRKILTEIIIEDKNADLNDIDVSKITDMSKLFLFLDPHNIDISNWDVSNVKNMNFMFYKCDNFNSDISDWDVSNVKDMSSMFSWCENFEGKGLEKWNVSNVKDMEDMFEFCVKFTNENIKKWNIDNKKTNITNMFAGCTYLKNKPSWYKK